MPASAGLGRHFQLGLRFWDLSRHSGDIPAKELVPVALGGDDGLIERSLRIGAFVLMGRVSDGMCIRHATLLGSIFATLCDIR